MRTITPNLWFDHDAAEAVEFYTSVFPDSRTTRTVRYPTEGLPDFQKDFAGKVLTIELELGGQPFMAINAGPEFRFNHSVSFIVNFDPSRDDDARAHLDELWAALSEGGEALMPLDEYPFSRRYGWVQDRYGLSWQLMLTDPEGAPRPFLTPSLMFAGVNTNRARDAVEFYASVFPDSQVGLLAPYPEQTGPAQAGSLMFGEVRLDGEWFAVMDSGVEQNVLFNEAVSFSVACRDQEEIDYYWGRLSHVPEAEQCGWCKDQFGLSWQIVPAAMDELMSRPGAYEAMMQMKKLVIAEF